MNKLWSTLLLALLTFAVTVPDADAARRLGGGASIGKQRSSPAMREAPREPVREAPREAARPSPAPSAAAAAPQAAVPPRPSFMSRWGGVIAGVGMGALLGSMLGGHLGGFGAALGGILNVLLVVGVLWLLYRLFMSRRAMSGGGPQYAGAYGGAAGRVEPQVFRAASPSRPAAAAAPAFEATSVPSSVPPGFDVEPFLREAKSSFIRMQAANDGGDLADLRDTTTPEVFAELAMQIRERDGAKQKTDVVTLDAHLVEVVVEGDQMIASLRYSGLMREDADAPAKPFDEVWHLRRRIEPANGPWLVAGIQQMA